LGSRGVISWKIKVKSEIVKSDSIKISSIDKKIKFVGFIITNDNNAISIVI